MYESPIEFVTSELTKQLEGDVLTLAQSYGVRVDKDELIRALNYDRQQYEKGFADGKAAAANNQVNLCDSCTYTYPECPSEKDDVIFGNGIGNDNICACNKYQPTVQPVATDTNVGDKISRQMAIDGKIQIQRANGVEIYSDEAVPVEYLKRLPTIQPELKESWLYDYLVGRLGKSIVDNKEEFHKWFERMVWHVKRCDELSEAQRSRRWIPCEERLPEKTPLWKTVGYLATVTCDSWEEPRTMYVKWETTTVRGKEVSRWTFDNRLFPSEWRVVAWMPMPEAYKEGGERI